MRMNFAAFGLVPLATSTTFATYGVGADGYPRSTWDNVGVQYGPLR